MTSDDELRRLAALWRKCSGDESSKQALNFCAAQLELTLEWHFLPMMDAYQGGKRPEWIQDMDMLRQVRKALNDITASFGDNRADKALHQLYLLRKMVDADKPQPWSHYQPQVDEEFR